jgi:hypothetical protein
MAQHDSLAVVVVTGDDRVGRSVAGDWATISMPVALVEEMLDTVSNLLAYTSPSFSPLYVAPFVHVS